MRSLSHPGGAHLDASMMLAMAWISASGGAVSRAIDEARSAADAAAARGLLAREVVCLQTATRFGDPGTASRLHDLAAMVENRRAPTVAAHCRRPCCGGVCRRRASVDDGLE
jgi:hypothetical protein